MFILVPSKEFFKAFGYDTSTTPGLRLGWLKVKDEVHCDVTDVPSLVRTQAFIR